MLIEMDTGGVLVKSRRNLVLGLLDSDAIGVIDLLADIVVAITARAAGKREIVGFDIDARTRAAELAAIDRSWQRWNVLFWCGRCRVALSHHYPAHIVEHFNIVLVEPA